MGGLPDEAVEPQPLEQSPGLGRCQVWQDVAYVAALEAAEVELAAADDLEEAPVFAAEEIEAAVAAFMLPGGAADPVQVLEAVAGVAERSLELQIPAVRGAGQFCQNRQAVERLLSGAIFCSEVPSRCSTVR